MRHRSFQTDALVDPPGGGDWSSVRPDGQDVRQLERILDIVRRQGILIATRGDWYYLSDEPGDSKGQGYVIRNSAPLECACAEDRDVSGACVHVLALRAVRSEFFVAARGRGGRGRP